jgi:hypothetical protein
LAPDPVRREIHNLTATAAVLSVQHLYFSIRATQFFGSQFDPLGASL